MTLMCLLSIVSVLLLRRLPASASVPPPPAILFPSILVVSLFYAGLAAWGIFTGVGLIRLKAWARASVLVLGGLMDVAAIGAIPVILVMSRLPDTGKEVPGARAAGLVVTGVFLAVMAGVGTWWLVLFNLKSVRAQFDETRATGVYAEGPHTAQARAIRPRRPLSITIIAVLYLMGLPGALFALIRPYPAILMGQVLEGNPARLVFIVQGAIVLTLGVGLLQLKPWARILGICLSAVYALSGVVLYFMPASSEKMLAAMMKFTPPEAQRITAGMLRTMLPFGLLIGILFSLAILWILAANKAAFTSDRAGASGTD